MSSVSEAKMMAMERLSVFVLKLWGAVAKVAAWNAPEAQRIMSEHHVFGGAWVRSPKLVVEHHGLDDELGYGGRFAGATSRVISFTSRRRLANLCAPESACKVHPGAWGKEDDAD